MTAVAGSAQQEPTAPSFALLDAAGNPADVHDDETGATYTIRLANASPSPLPLVAGPALSEDGAGGATDGATRWYLSFPSVLDESMLANLAISADGWTITPYSFNTRTYWGFVPTTGLTLAPNEAVNFTVDGLAVTTSERLRTLDLTVDWYAGPSAVDTTLGMSARVVANPATNSFTVQVDPTTENVYVSAGGDAYPNTVRLIFQNGPTPLPNNGTVTIEVPIAPAPSAVTTANFAAQISCAIATEPADSSWAVTTTQPETEGNAAWLLTPGTTASALAPAESLAVELRNIVSPLPALPAVVTVSIVGFDGFADTTPECSLVLRALPAPVFIDSGVTGTTGAQPFPYDSAIGVSWETTFATSLSLEYDDGISQVIYTSEQDGLPLSGSHALPNTTVDAQVTLVASNSLNTTRSVLPVLVSLPTLELTVTSGIGAWDFTAGPATIVYALAASPAALVQGFQVTSPSGTTALAATATLCTVTQSAGSGQVSVTATFARGVDQNPNTIDVTTAAPEIPSFASYLVGTSWVDPQEDPTTPWIVFTDATNCTLVDTPPTPYSAEANVVQVLLPGGGNYVPILAWTPPNVAIWSDASETLQQTSPVAALPSSTAKLGPSSTLPPR